MANWSLPTITDLYTNFLAYLKARDDDATRMHDSRVTAATNVPDYAKRWNATTQTFQNWLSAAWATLVLAIAGGGTGASTAAGARTNLDVYSKAEADALFATSLTTAENTLAGAVALSDINVYYDGPSVSLAAGTWLIVGTITLGIPASATATAYAKLWDGVGAAITENLIRTWPNTVDRYFSLPLHGIVTLGATTTIKLSAKRTESGIPVMVATYSNMHALKIA